MKATVSRTIRTTTKTWRWTDGRGQKRGKCPGILVHCIQPADTRDFSDWHSHSKFAENCYGFQSIAQLRLLKSFVSWLSLPRRFPTVSIDLGWCEINIDRVQLNNAASAVAEAFSTYGTVKEPINTRWQWKCYAVINHHGKFVAWL